MKERHTPDASNCANRFLITGGTSGGITNPVSAEAVRHARLYYEEIRSFSTDVEKISTNTGYNQEDVLRVKEYLFIDRHVLDNGFKRFDPCFEIAESWRRLAFDKSRIQPHDIILLQHEIMEMELVCGGLSQNEAHERTSKIYNYTKASGEYYREMNRRSILD